MTDATLIALIGALGAIIAAYFGFRAVRLTEENKQEASATAAVMGVAELRMDYWERQNASLLADLEREKQVVAELRRDAAEERAVAESFARLLDRREVEIRILREELQHAGINPADVLHDHLPAEEPDEDSPVSP